MIVHDEDLYWENARCALCHMAIFRHISQFFRWLWEDKGWQKLVNQKTRIRFTLDAGSAQLGG
jgi:hypothetical protein